MKKSNFKKYWYCIPLILALMAFSVICWMNFAKAYPDRAETTPLAEPSETASDGVLQESADLIDRHVDQADTIWSENVEEKKVLSNTDSRLSYMLSHYISSTQVLLGKNNWLFYKTTTDGDPIADYEGTNIYDQDVMDYLTGQAASTEEALQSRGIISTLFLAPNKEPVYSECMPDIYTCAEKSRSDILISYMQSQGLSAVSPKASLLENHQNYNLYYAYDTHWNQLGAYLGVRDILTAWGINIPDLSERTITKFRLESKYPNHHVGAADDLANLAGLSFLSAQEMEYTVDGTPEMDWVEYSQDEVDKVADHYTNENASVDATVFLVGDSFRTAMIPLLREVFSEVYVIHRYNYNISMLDEFDPDYMIMEYAERYTDEISTIHSLVSTEG